MLAIDAIRAGVDGAPWLPDRLAAGWDAFELLRSVADRCGGGGLFAAFLLASAAADSAQDAIGAAPSTGARPRQQYHARQ
jgi:hypothetical protein